MFFLRLMFVYNYILAIYEFLVVVENFIFLRGALGYLIFFDDFILVRMYYTRF
ncbi:hypothetical protein SJDPG12_02870 [Porphyromonas gingivalis SJD12]|nr:hypothetical protein SJDPG12_02870 [Porphyromonas gingivalis SJD12]